MQNIRSLHSFVWVTSQGQRSMPPGSAVIAIRYALVAEEQLPYWVLILRGSYYLGVYTRVPCFRIFVKPHMIESNGGLPVKAPLTQLQEGGGGGGGGKDPGFCVSVHED